MKANNLFFIKPFSHQPFRQLVSYLGFSCDGAAYLFVELIPRNLTFSNIFYNLYHHVLSILPLPRREKHTSVDSFSFRRGSLYFLKRKKTDSTSEPAFNL